VYILSETLLWLSLREDEVHKKECVCVYVCEESKWALVSSLESLKRDSGPSS